MSQLTQANASSAQAGPTCESGNASSDQAGPTCESGNASSDQAGPTCESGNASSAQAGPVTHRVIKRLSQKLSEAVSTSPSSDSGTSASSTVPMGRSAESERGSTLGALCEVEHWDYLSEKLLVRQFHIQLDGGAKDFASSWLGHDARSDLEAQVRTTASAKRIHQAALWPCWEKQE